MREEEKVYYEPDGRKYKKERFLKRIPRYTYIKGKFIGKFYADKKEFKDQLEKEAFFEFKIYEGEVEISAVQKSEFRKPEDSSKIILDKSQLPNQIDYYQFIEQEKTYYNDIDEKIHDVSYINVKFISQLQQTESDEAFGTVTADFYGCLIDYLEEERYRKRYALIKLIKVKEEIETETSIKEDSETNSVRNNTLTNTTIKEKEILHRENSTCLWQMIALFVLTIFLLVLGFSLGAFLSFLFLLYFGLTCLFRLYPVFRKILIGILGLITLLGLIFILLKLDWSLSLNKNTFVPKKNNEFSKVLILHKAIRENNATWIEQSFRWKGYNNELYTGKFRISTNKIENAKSFKNNLNPTTHYPEVLNKLYLEDKNNLEGVYKMFEKIKTEKNLSDKSFVEMVVSFTQHIPYVLLLTQSCDADLYKSEKNIARILEKHPCSPYVKFGINSPVEFIASQNGDCDTRTLFLFTILDHFGYDVAIFSSDVYQHSIFGIKSNSNGAKKDGYILWETTMPNLKPGVIPLEVSNINNWILTIKN